MGGALQSTFLASEMDVSSSNPSRPTKLHTVHMASRPEANKMSEFQLAGPDMLIDGYDQYNQRQDAEVVNITPDDASEEPAEDALLADDCMYPRSTR